MKERTMNRLFNLATGVGVGVRVGVGGRYTMMPASMVVILIRFDAKV